MLKKVMALTGRWCYCWRPRRWSWRSRHGDQPVGARSASRDARSAAAGRGPEPARGTSAKLTAQPRWPHSPRREQPPHRRLPGGLREARATRTAQGHEQPLAPPRAGAGPRPGAALREQRLYAHQCWAAQRPYAAQQRGDQRLESERRRSPANPTKRRPFDQ